MDEHKRAWLFDLIENAFRFLHASVISVIESKFQLEARISIFGVDNIVNILYGSTGRLLGEYVFAGVECRNDRRRRKYVGRGHEDRVHARVEYGFGRIDYGEVRKFECEAFRIGIIPGHHFNFGTRLEHAGTSSGHFSQPDEGRIP